MNLKTSETGRHTKKNSKLSTNEQINEKPAKSNHAKRMNSLHKFSRDAKRNRGKVLSFSKPKDSDAESLGYEIVGPCPSIKIYSDIYPHNQNISSEDNKVIEMLKTPTNNKVDVESSDVSSYTACKFSDGMPKRPQSCENINYASKSRRHSKKRNKSKESKSKNARRESKNREKSHPQNFQETLQNGNLQDLDKPLTTREVLQLMNYQMQNIRNEFMTVLQTITSRIEPLQENPHAYFRDC